MLLTAGTGTTASTAPCTAIPAWRSASVSSVPVVVDAGRVPIYRRDPFGMGWDWHLQLPGGQLEWIPTAHPHGRTSRIDPTDVDAALAVFREMVAREAEASPWG